MITQLDIVTAPALNEEGIAALEAGIADLLYYYDEYVVTRERVYEERALEQRAGISPLLAIVAVMVLLFFPLACFFSQFLFYFKRNQEFSVLLAIGAVPKEINRIHRIDSTLLSAANFVLTLGLSFFLNWLVYAACNTWLPSLGIIGNVVRYQYSISPVMLILCLAVSLVCGILSCEIPCRRFMARHKKLATQVDGLDDTH